LRSGRLGKTSEGHSGSKEQAKKASELRVRGDTSRKIC
jgi:hypothetical protein